MVPQEICDKICMGLDCHKSPTVCPNHLRLCCMECTFLDKVHRTCAPFSQQGLDNYFKFIILYKKHYRSFT